MNKNRDVTMYFDDIIKYCGRIMRTLSKINLDEFRKSEDAQDSVIRRFEVIGEAVKNIPDEIKKQYPKIPWKDAAGFRDFLIHDYPEVVIDRVYITGTQHLPQFKKQIEVVLKNLTK